MEAAPTLRALIDDGVDEGCRPLFSHLRHYCTVGPINRRCDPRGSGFETGQPRPPHLILGYDDVVAMGYSVQEAPVGKSRQLGTRVGVHLGGILWAYGPQREPRQLGW